jgi:hypothetical protein
MTDMLEVYCSLCGEDMTNKTVAEITEHLKTKHSISLLDSIYEQLKTTLNNIWEVER